MDTGEKGPLLCGGGRKLATPLPIVTQKVESVPKELGALAKEISRQCQKSHLAPSYGLMR